MSSFGVSEDFFSYVDKHRAALLCSLRVFEESEKGEQSYKETNHQNKITSSQVLEAIENVILGVVKSLSRNEAPYLTFDKRSNWENIEFTDCVGLQMIPHCTTRRVKSDCPKSAQRFALILKILSMIYKMVQNNSYATKRDIFYTDVQLFGTQSVVDNIVNDISCMLKMPRRSLHVLSTSKGCIAGDLCYSEKDGTQVNCRSNSMAVLVPSNVHGIKNLTSDAKFILIIEKDATFQRLLDDEFCSKITPCIIITGVNMYNSFWVAPCISPALDTCFIYSYVHQGKGVPDLNTRLFVRKLWDTFQIPIFTLVDADPHGIEIMCIYKYGSLSMSFEAHSLTVPAVRWIGLFPSDIERLNIPKDALIPLTQLDQKKLANMQKRPYIACQPLWKREMELMAASKMKAEIQALTSLSADYLTRVYLPNKLQFGGWI